MARRAAVVETEPVPEPDRLEPYPHPRDTADLYGHGEAIADFRAGFESGRLHHGWLIAGPAGIGKATLAYRMAAWLMVSPGERRDPERLAVDPAASAQRQIRASAHPDLLVLRRAWNSKTKKFANILSVDEVRRLKSFLGHTAVGDGWRVVIVDPADDLNAQAANALLKSLEEPPARTVFLLIVAEPGRLLPTIRSRCRVLPLAPLADADLWLAAGAAMTAAGVEPPLPDERKRVTALAEGSVRRFLTLAAGGGLAMADKVARALSLLPKVDWPAVHALADDVSGADNTDRFDQFYELLLERLRALIRARATAAAGVDGDLAARLIPAAALASWAELWERIAREKAEAEVLNLDRRALLLGTFAELESAARLASAGG